MDGNSWEESFEGRQQEKRIERASQCGQAILRAAQEGNLPAIRRLRGLSYEEGGPLLLRLTAVDENGNSALHTAAELGYRDIVEYLLDQGMHGARKNKDGLTPTDLAMLNERPQLAHYIKRRVESQQSYANDAMSVYL